jgi:hypothetical protein
MSVTPTVQGIKSIIIKGRDSGLSDYHIDEEICNTYGKLDYSVCARVDRDLFGCTGYGYWRIAFDYPNDGDCVRLPSKPSITARVIICGFFTFEVETDYENIINAQYANELALVCD